MPDYIKAALGVPPLFVDERRDYDAVAEAITAYRERHGLAGARPLGPRPTDPRQLAEFLSVQRTIEEYRRRLDRFQEPPTIQRVLGR